MIDISQLSKVLDNVVKYTDGFLVGVKTGQIMFNKRLGKAIVGMLYEYLDSTAQVSPGKLGHMYEPDMTGDPKGRLYKLDFAAGMETINIKTSYIESTLIPNNLGHPFRERAEVMEEGNPVTIRPLNPGGVLVFMYQGELVVTPKTITVQHPGGEDAEGGFSNAIKAFFDSYIEKSIIDTAMKKMSKPTEYGTFFEQGAKLGKLSGIRAGTQYVERGSSEFI